MHFFLFIVSLLSLSAGALALPADINGTLQLSGRDLVAGIGRYDSDNLECSYQSKQFELMSGIPGSCQAFPSSLDKAIAWRTGIFWGTGKTRPKGVCFFKDLGCKVKHLGYNAGGDFESTCLDGNELGDYNSFILVPPKGGKSPCKLK